MKTLAEHRKYDAEEHRRLIQLDWAALQRLREGLLQTQIIIQRSAVAYVASRWALDGIEQTRSKSDLTAPPIMTYESSRSPSGSGSARAGASAFQQLTPDSCNVEAIVELMTERLAELVNAEA